MQSPDTNENDSEPQLDQSQSPTVLADSKRVTPIGFIMLGLSIAWLCCVVWLVRGFVISGGPPFEEYFISLSRWLIPGGVLSGGTLIWLALPKYQWQKYFSAYILLLIGGTLIGVNWGAQALYSDLAEKARQELILEKTMATYGSKLYDAVVDSDKKLGLSALNSASKIHPKRNFLISPPALGQVLHLVMQLGNDQISSEVRTASGMGEVPKQLTIADQVVKRLIVMPRPGADTSWKATVNLSPSSDIKPSPILTELIKSYTGGGVATDSKLLANQCNFETVIDFDGTWKNQFNTGKTNEQGFNVSNDKLVQLPFMHKHFYEGGATTYYFGNDEAQVVGLPYESNEKVMYVILPNGNTDLQKFIGDLSVKKLSKMLSFGRDTDGDLALPRFKVQTGSELSDVLKDMGVKQMFQPSAMPVVGPGSWCVDSVKQKANLEVNEHGTKIRFQIDLDLHNLGESFNMSVDRPFLFIITDKRTGEWLFLGAIFDPSKS